MNVVPKDCYVPVRVKEFFSVPIRSLEHAKELESCYFGRNVNAGGIVFFIDFRLSLEECLATIPKGLDKIRQGQIKQVVERERKDFDYEFFRRINRFHQFIDWLWQEAEDGGMKRDYNLKLHRLDPIGRTFVVYNAQPSNEWARLSCIGHRRCYFSRLKFLHYLRERKGAEAYSDYLEVEKVIEA